MQDCLFWSNMLHSWKSTSARYLGDPDILREVWRRATRFSWQPGADPGFPYGGGQGRGAAGAEVLGRRREDRGAEGGGVWGGGLIFHLKKSEFQCIMGSILSQFSCPFYSKKKQNNICMKWNGLSGDSGPNMAYLKMKPHNLLQQLSKFVIYSTSVRWH